MALPFSDDFNRANENPLSGGGNWSRASGANGDWRVSNNQAVSGLGTTPWASAVVSETFDSDHYAEAKGIDLSNSPAGVAVRVQTTGGLDCYVLCGRSTSIQRMYEVNAGTFTQLGSDFGETISASTVLRLEAEGSTLRFKTDGTEVGTRSDSTHTGGTVGLAGTVGQNYDDFVGDNLTAPAAIEYPITRREYRLH
jgi:hypothetical protein